jgi:hypothetical protein
MLTNLQIYKNNINSKLTKLNVHVNKIYGGLTEHTIEERAVQHIGDNQPFGCNNNWLCDKVTTYTLTGNVKFDEHNISKIENYLINYLNITFSNRCINSRNKNGIIAQRGGNGLNINNNNIGDKITFYIFYELIEPNNIFV